MRLPAAGVVRRNVASLGASGRTDVLMCDAFQLTRRTSVPGAPFDLVVLDPPYALSAERVSGLVEDLGKAGLLVPGALVLYERAADAPALSLASATMVRERSHGSTAVNLYRTEEE